MNLLYIIDKLHQHAGMERILSSKMNYLSRLPGWRVSLATYEQKCRLDYRKAQGDFYDGAGVAFLKANGRT